MSRREAMVTGAAVAVIGFFINLWAGAWFLRGGAEGPNAWAFLPVYLTGVIMLVAFGACLSNVNHTK